MKHFVSLFLITNLIFYQLNVIAEGLLRYSHYQISEKLLVMEKDILNNKIDIILFAIKSTINYNKTMLIKNY